MDGVGGAGVDVGAEFIYSDGVVATDAVEELEVGGLQRVVAFAYGMAVGEHAGEGVAVVNVGGAGVHGVAGEGVDFRGCVGSAACGGFLRGYLGDNFVVVGVFHDVGRVGSKCVDRLAALHQVVFIELVLVLLEHFAGCFEAGCPVNVDIAAVGAEGCVKVGFAYGEGENHRVPVLGEGEVYSGLGVVGRPEVGKVNVVEIEGSGLALAFLH